MEKILVLLICLVSVRVSAQYDWTARADYPEAVFYPTSFVIGDYAYVGLGSLDAVSPVYSDHFFRYDPESDTWDTIASFPGGGRFSATGFSLNGLGYVCFGVNDSFEWTSEVWEYDPLTDSWSQKSDFPGGARYGACSFVVGPYAYITGGSYNDLWNLLHDNWQYDQTTDTWTQKSDLPVEHKSLGVGLSLDGKGYVLTGTYDGFTTTNDFWEYDPDIDYWESMPPLPEISRTAAVGFILNNNFVIGTGTDLISTFRSFWQYETGYSEWYPLEGLPPTTECRYGSTGFSIQDVGYVVGGLTEHIYTALGELLNDNWAYNLLTSSSTGILTDFMLYPNPTSGLVTIRDPGNSRIGGTLTVYNSVGSILHTEHLSFREGLETIDLGFLEAGYYFIAYSEPTGAVYHCKTVLSK